VPGGRKEFSACRGESDTSWSAAEQCVADLVLQAPDLLAQWRLGDAQTGGSASEVEFLGEHDEGVRLLKRKFRTFHTLRDITSYVKLY
jgi:hypothetical protein